MWGQPAEDLQREAFLWDLGPQLPGPQGRLRGVTLSRADLKVLSKVWNDFLIDCSSKGPLTLEFETTNPADIR